MECSKNFRKELIINQIFLVSEIVKNYEGLGYDLNDLMSCGILGLIEGIDLSNDILDVEYLKMCIINSINTYISAEVEYTCGGKVEFPVDECVIISNLRSLITCIPEEYREDFEVCLSLISTSTCPANRVSELYKFILSYNGCLESIFEDDYIFKKFLKQYADIVLDCKSEYTKIKR